MNRRFWMAWLAVFVAWVAGDFLIHHHLLGPEYFQLSQLFRPEEEAMARFPLMVVAHLILAGAFTWIYSRGVSPSPWLGQGIRFGIAIAFLTVPTYLIYYVVQPMPQTLVTKQILFDGILMIVLGIVVAAVYRSRPSPA